MKKRYRLWCICVAQAIVVSCGSTRVFNRGPRADAGGPYEGITAFPIPFDGSGSHDPEGDPLTYHWNFGDGTEGDMGAAPSYAYAVPGNYAVCLTVKDGVNRSSPSCTTALIKEDDANIPPVALPGGETSMAMNDAAHFDGEWSYDFDGYIVGYAWDFGDGETGMGVTAAHVYRLYGSYTVTLTVTDDKGAQGSGTLKVNVFDKDAELTILNFFAVDTTAGHPYFIDAKVGNTGTVPVPDALFHTEVHDSCMGHHLEWSLTDQTVSFETGEEKDVVWSGDVPVETTAGEYSASLNVSYSGKTLSTSASFTVH